MTDNEKKLFEGFLSKTLNLDAEAVSGLFNTDGELTDLSSVLAADAARVEKFRTEKQNQYQRGIKENAEKLEKELKKKYSVDSDLLGVELFDHILEMQTAELNDKLSKKGAKDEDFEKHPKYAQLKKDHEKAIADKESEWKGKLEEKESAWTREKTLTKVAQIAFSELDEGYVMPENSERAKALKEVMQKELDQHSYKFLDDGTPVIIDQEGKPLEDNHGKMVSYKDHINMIASKFFDKKIAQLRENSGNEGKLKQQQTGVFKTKEEFTEAMKVAKTPEDQSAVLKKLQASNLN